MAFNFIELDKTNLPKTKGMRVDGHRFYNINGTNYPSSYHGFRYQKNRTIKRVARKDW